MGRGGDKLGACRAAGLDTEIFRNSSRFAGPKVNQKPLARKVQLVNKSPPVVNND